MKKDAIILQKKKIPALLRGMMSKDHGGFYCLNCLHSFGTEKKNVNLIKKHVKIKIFVTLECLLKRLKY